MQQELIEMLEKVVDHVVFCNGHDQRFSSTSCGVNILKEAGELVEKAKKNVSTQEQCNACLGTGRMVRDPDIGTDQECFVCDGSGYEPEQEVGLTDDDITRCINVATCGRPFIGLMNSGGVPSAFSRSLADLLIAALRAKGNKL